MKLLNVFKESMTIKKKTEEKAEKNSRRLKKKKKQQQSKINKQKTLLKPVQLLESSLIGKQQIQAECIPRSFGNKNQLSDYKYFLITSISPTESCESKLKILFLKMRCGFLFSTTPIWSVAVNVNISEVNVNNNK